jgi:hypothetical protein
LGGKRFEKGGDLGISKRVGGLGILRRVEDEEDSMDQNYLE